MAEILFDKFGTGVKTDGRNFATWRSREPVNGAYWYKLVGARGATHYLLPLSDIATTRERNNGTVAKFPNRFAASDVRGMPSLTRYHFGIVDNEIVAFVAWSPIPGDTYTPVK